MKTVDLILKLQNTSSTLDKKKILKEQFEDGDWEFFRGAQLALNKLTSYGIKKVPYIDSEDDGIDDLPFSDFIKLLHRLETRELTGNNAINAVRVASERSSIDKWNLFYRQILLRDLKCGVATSLINDVLSEFNNEDSKNLRIPVFQCQLAEDSKKHKNKLRGNKLLDVKLDGVRILSIINVQNNSVTQYTRSGIETNKFPHIVNMLTDMIPYLNKSIVLDGEILSGSFQELMEEFNKKDANTSSTKLGLFDIIPYDDFIIGKCDISQIDRHSILSNMSGIIQSVSDGGVYVIPKTEVDLDTDEGINEMTEFFNNAVKAGFEGIMIKNPDSPYEGRKTSHWLKWKPSISVTLRVVDIEKGGDDSEFKNTLGSLLLEGYDIVDGSPYNIKTSCGSGFDLLTRQQWWDNPDDIINWMVEIEADSITPLKDDGTVSLRFPRFKGKRGTKPLEKI